MPYFWIIFSYVLGSIPFGYLISRFSGKDILKVGWRKTSGSNVFKNVGKWQGILTGLLDLAKGYLAVYGAQKIGLSTEIQIFSGVAAVTGHNWSIFLKFAGGRGIGTFIGAFLTLSPVILLYSIIPLIILGIIWNLAIGTLLFLATAIYLSYYFGQFETGGAYTLVSLAPILIKRLSPIKEIRESQNKAALIRNRLLFDNDEALLDLRIKRIFQRTQDNPDRVMKIVKPITAPIWWPSKIGWQVAKFGVKMAKKPIEKFILKNHEKVVTEIGIEDFKKMMIAASKKIVLHQEEINKINVWPVADKDTGYNLAATLLGVEGVISQKDYLNLRELTKDIKEAAMVNARGNAGMILTGYLIEVLDRIKHLESIDAFHLALAMKKGIKAAWSSIAEPVEGTILDVIKAAGEKVYEVAKMKKEKNIIKVLGEAQKVSEVALKETKEKLQVLKENDVVDAGALGFVKILEAWIESLKGVVPVAKFEDTFPLPPPDLEQKLKHRYEVVLSFRKNKEISAEDLKEELSSLGDSLEIIELEGKIKLHIHTNEPEMVAEKFKNFQGFESRMEDMERSGLVGDESKDSSSPTRAQRRMEKNRMFVDSPRRPLGLIVDEIADLPKEFLEKNGIMEVSFTTRFPDGEIVKSKEEIYPKMREALEKDSSLPTTSAPSFKEFLSVYQKALKNFEKILVVTVSSKLSGSYSSARIARSIFKKPEKLNIYVFDCNTAEVGEGLVAIKAQELISRALAKWEEESLPSSPTRATAKGKEEDLSSSPSQGKKMEEIIEKLKEFCPKITLLACIDDFKYVVRGGRVRLPKIFINPASFIQKLGIRFLVGLKNGKVKFSGASLGKDKARILTEAIDSERKGVEIKVAIAHADNLKEAQKLKTELEKRPKIKVLYVSSVSPVVATHTGPGALLAAFYPVDN